MADFNKLKLGKAEPKDDKRTLAVRDYVDTELIAPSKFSISNRVSRYPMYGNDQYGDCTIAAVAHLDQIWSKVGRHYKAPASQAVVDKYFELSGGQDSGLYEIDVLNEWRQNGMFGEKILAYAAVDPTNILHVKLATWLFGGLYLGIALPETAQDQLSTQGVWTVDKSGVHGNPAPGSWGGHAVPGVFYSPWGIGCITWAERLSMSWEFFTTYVDEAYAIIPQEWEKGQPYIKGVDFEALKKDLANITN